MVLAQKDYYTIDDIYGLPEGQRAELIEGQLYMMAPPGLTHQSVLQELYLAIALYIKRKGGACLAMLAPFAVFLKNDGRTYVEPDISIICDRSKLDEKGCHGAPDWILEIVSPGSQKMDYLLKLLQYQSSGVREYWIVDPKRSDILVYNFELNDMHRYTFSDRVPGSVFPDLTIDFSSFKLN